jgi:hypothetical protein
MILCTEQVRMSDSAWCLRPTCLGTLGTLHDTSTEIRLRRYKGLVGSRFDQVYEHHTKTNPHTSSSSTSQVSPSPRHSSCSDSSWPSLPTCLFRSILLISMSSSWYLASSLVSQTNLSGFGWPDLFRSSRRISVSRAVCREQCVASSVSHLPFRLLQPRDGKQTASGRP